MRMRSSQMKRREAFSTGQDSSNSCFRLLGRRVSLLSSLVIVALTLHFSAAAPSAATDVSTRDTCSVGKLPRCIPVTDLSFSSPYYRRSRNADNAAAPYFSARRPRSVVAYIQSPAPPLSQLASWSLKEKLHGRRGRLQQGPHAQQRPQHGCEALFFSDSGVWPIAHECSSVFHSVIRGCFQQASPTPPLFLSVKAIAEHKANTQQWRMIRREFSMIQQCCAPSTFTVDGAIRSTSSVPSSAVMAEPATGRRFGERSQGEYLEEVNYSGVASIKDSAYPLQRDVERLLSEEQHPHSTALHIERTSLFNMVDQVSRVPPENSGGGVCIEERQQDSTALKAGLATSADLAVKSAVTCVPSFPLKKESWSPCAHPGDLQENDVATADTVFPFPRLGLFPNFVEALTHLGVHSATEIQQLGLPAIFSGADIVLGAETGSGKTLGYLLGILQNVLVQKMIHERKEDAAMMKKEDLPLPPHYPYAIVVVPTRELALQVVAWSRRLCRKTPVSVQLLLGSYSRWPFGTLTLPTSPDVIVCTPQVLAGFTRGGGYKRQLPLFEQTQMLVVDEADMLLEGGYKKLMESVFLEFRKSDRILAAAGKRGTQYIFAAATIPERGPVSIRKTIRVLCPGASFLCTNSLHCQRRELQQEFVRIRADASFDERTSCLLDKLREIPLTERVMIFCNTAQTAKQVLEVLEKALPPAANPKLFSSDLDQKDRTRNLGLFAREKSKVLVCTDAASRGLDIIGVTNVIQFDFALNAATHLHRVGRVARAGKFGRAINFYEPASKPLVDAVRKAAIDPTQTSLADAFSRKRSFRKSLKKADSSVALVVDYPSPAVGLPTRVQGSDQ